MNPISVMFKGKPNISKILWTIFDLNLSFVFVDSKYKVWKSDYFVSGFLLWETYGCELWEVL